MKEKSLKKNFIYNLIYQIAIICLPIITAPYISRVLGAENIGIYGYTQSISTYFILFGLFGISLYGQREIAYLQKSKEKYSVAFWEILLFKFITLFISTALYYVVFVSSQNEYNIYFKLLLLDFIAHFFDISWFFQGLEEFKKIVFRNLAIRILGIVSIFLFVKNPSDLNLYFIIYGVSNVLGNLILWVHLPKNIAKVKIKELNIFKHLKPNFLLFIPQIAMQVYTVLDKSMIGLIISDKSEVGYYIQGEKIIKMLVTAVISLGTVMIPRIASRFAENDNTSIKRYLEKSFNITYLLAFPMIFGIVLISKSFVPIFFGEGYDKVVNIMIALSPIILLIGMGHVTGMQYLVTTKQQKKFSISVTLGALVNVVMNIIFINLYGALGAAIGTVLAEFTTSFSQLIFIRKELDVKNILKMSRDYLIASLVMFGVCYPLSFLIDSGWLHIVISTILGGLIYLILLILLKNKFVKDIFSNIIVKLKKKIIKL